ncbi:MAG: hypothetical protein HRT57_11875 [Crocinitomicaceae bacterium]|nr:hypothetical protein [Crocinitomicaceae bacterium]
MKRIITCLSLIFMSQIVFSQNYDELKILYADGNYKKLVAKAIKIIENDKRKKEIPPYIWAARGLHKIHLSGDSDEKYKNAYKDAIKYLGKGTKYDLKYNDGATMADEEFIDFVQEFQMTLCNRVTNEFDGETPKKAYSWAIKYNKISENIVGAKYIAGACKFVIADPGTARVLWKEADLLLKDITSLDTWSEADNKMLMYGILYSAEALKGKRQLDKAKILLNKVAQWFEEDETWKEKYDDIVN